MTQLQMVKVLSSISTFCNPDVQLFVLAKFSVYFVLKFESSGIAISISRQVSFFFCHAVLYQVGLLVFFDL